METCLLHDCVCAVLLEHCETPGGLECGNGADLVRITGGGFGKLTLTKPRRVHISNSTVQEMLVDVREEPDGRETVRPAVTLENVTLKSGKPTVLGDVSRVRVLDSPR